MNTIYQLTLATSFSLALMGCSDMNENGPTKAELREREVQEFLLTVNKVELPKEFKRYGGVAPTGVYEVETKVFGESQQCLANVIQTHRGRQVIVTNCKDIPEEVGQPEKTENINKLNP